MSGRVYGTHQLPRKELNRPRTLQPGTETGDRREVYKLAGSIDKPKQGPLLTFPWYQDDGLARDAFRQFRKQTGSTFFTHT